MAKWNLKFLGEPLSGPLQLLKNYIILEVTPMTYNQIFFVLESLSTNKIRMFTKKNRTLNIEI